jgi:uncharacterized protein involved in type VI secretion and phage assembly
MAGDKVYGVMVGTVVDANDPQGEGRVKLRFPWLGGKDESYWAPVASALAGGGRGAFFMPEPEDEVLVAFEFGDVNHPFVIGFLWNGSQKPPSTSVRERMIRSVNGHAIRFLDSTPTNGNLGALVIEDAHGNRITLSNGKITIKSVSVLEIDSPIITLSGPGYRRIVSPNNNPI